MTKDEMLDELSVLYERFSNGMGWRDGDYAEALSMAIEALESAEQKEQKKGEWKHVPPYEEEVKQTLQWYECSVCGNKTLIIGAYCPNCGADMRGASDDGN